jgi:hypothetical protein
MITLDMKAQYVNLHTQNFLHINEFLLNKHNQDETMTGKNCAPNRCHSKAK